MATERQLRERMRRLENQMAQQEQRRRELEARISRQTEEQIRRMQQQAQATFQRKLDETTEMYAQRVRQFQESIVHQSNQQLRELRQQADAVNRQLKKTLEELEKCNRELRDELQRLKDEEERRQTVFLRTAQEAQAQVQLARQEVRQTPHDFFCPQEFDIIDSHIADIAGLIENGMYQSAVSDANCLALEFRLLRTKVEQAFAEWMQAFEDYRCIINTLDQRLRDLESTSLETSEGSFCMKPRELNFWSSGTYSDLADKIRHARDTFAQMDEAQIRDYLHASAGTNRRAIFDLVVQGHRWEDQLTAVINCIQSERILSDQRLTVAREVAQMLDEQNYMDEVNRFQPPRAGTLTKSWYIAPADEDPMHSFVLQMTLGGRNRVKLLAMPRREHGLAVGNEFFLTVDFHSATDMDTELRVGHTNLQRIRALYPQLQLHFIPSADDPEGTIRKQEQRCNTPPSPSEQMRYLERKYR